MPAHNFLIDSIDAFFEADRLGTLSLSPALRLKDSFDVFQKDAGRCKVYNDSEEGGEGIDHHCKDRDRIFVVHEEGLLVNVT